jgi:hypothetical protein
MGLIPVIVAEHEFAHQFLGDAGDVGLVPHTAEWQSGIGRHLGRPVGAACCPQPPPPVGRARWAPSASTGLT